MGEENCSRLASGDDESITQAYGALAWTSPPLVFIDRGPHKARELCRLSHDVHDLGLARGDLQRVVASHGALPSNIVHADTLRPRSRRRIAR